jgi:hypothetical protein
MPDVSSTPDSPDAVALAVRNLMPGLRRQGQLTVAIMAAVTVIGVATAMWIVNSDMDGEDRFKFSLVTLGAAGFAVYHAYRWMRKQQEALLMPVLARTVGLNYDKNAKPFLKALPDRLLPKGVRTAEDHVHGNLGAHAIQLAEVNVETGGKNSRTLFKGLVAQFPNRVAMPAFFVALEDKTRPGFFFGGDLKTDGLHHLRNVTGLTGRTYGVWTSWSQMEEPPALAAVVEVLTRIENHVGSEAELYSATSNGEETHVALSHKRNLFRVGGLFPSESDIFADVRHAMQDLTVPLNLAKALISAEETAVAKVKGA